MSRRAVGLSRGKYFIHDLFSRYKRARGETGTSGGGCLPQMSFTACRRRRRRGARCPRVRVAVMMVPGDAVLEQLKAM